MTVSAGGMYNSFIHHCCLHCQSWCLNVNNRSRHCPPWLWQRVTASAGHNGEETGLTAGGSERSCQSCLSGSAFLHCDWSTPLPSLAADMTKNWLQDWHYYIQSQTDQHTSFHSIIDQWLHPITNFTIIWQVTVVPTCHYCDDFSKGFCFWLTYHWSRLPFYCRSAVTLVVLNANSKRFYLPHHTDLSSYRDQCLWFA